MIIKTEEETSSENKNYIIKTKNRENYRIL